MPPMFSGPLFGPPGLSTPVLNLDGHSVLATTIQSNKDSEAGFRFNSDGTVDRAKNEDEAGWNYLQVDADTDWIIPNEAAAAKTYHIKALHVSESGTPFKTGTLGSWINLNTSPMWDANRDRLGGNGISQWVISLAISDDGGSTTLVGPINYTMNAEIDV